MSGLLGACQGRGRRRARNGRSEKNETRLHATSKLKQPSSFLFFSSSSLLRRFVVQTIWSRVQMSRVELRFASAFTQDDISSQNGVDLITSVVVVPTAYNNVLYAFSSARCSLYLFFANQTRGPSLSFAAFSRLCQASTPITPPTASFVNSASRRAPDRLTTPESPTACPTPAQDTLGAVSCWHGSAAAPVSSFRERGCAVRFYPEAPSLFRC